MELAQLRSFLFEMGVDRVVTMVSRRAAGVWTLLPSLALQNLDDINGQATVLLVDFGLRHEMLEHWQIDPSKVPVKYSLLGICKLLEEKSEIQLLEYDRDILSKATRVVQPLPSVEDPGEDYLRCVHDLNLLGKRLFLCPFDSGPPQEAIQNPVISLPSLIDTLSGIVRATRPNLIYLTFEGQPERPLFDERLASDEVMVFCLDLCDVILSLVRTDSPTRFEEGITIPSFLAENQQWGSKIRLFLTRLSEEVSLPKTLNEVVIGQSPFLDVLHQSLQSGRIPWVDFKIERYPATQKQTIARYFSGLQQASKAIIGNFERRQVVERHYIFGYVNPDTDGTCSAIAYADYLRKMQNFSASAAIIGELNPETQFVLTHVGVESPPTISHFQAADKLHIVDTHQLNQLPSDLPSESVIEILDHHPVGNPEAFPRAVIVNEPIGAVATMIAERYQTAHITPDAKVAALLYSAIVSNTLDFKAPTTTDRDRAAAKWLLELANLPPNYVDAMFQARSDLGAKSTLDVLLSDYKEFDFSGVKVGMSQLETTALESFLGRSDLAEALDTILQQRGLAHVLLNGADIRSQTGALVAPREDTRQVLETTVGANFSGSVARFDRILLRKSDLIPQLTEYFKQKAAKS